MNTPADATPTLQTLLASQSLSELVRRLGALRGSSWDALVRVALAVKTDANLDPQRQIRWDSLRPASLDAPVTEADLRAYLAARPPFESVRFLASLFSVRDPRAVTHARLVELVTELYPDALPEALPHAGVHDPLAQTLFARPGAVLGEACARRTHTTPGSLVAGNQYSLPRYGRDPRANVLPAAPVPTALLPPTPLARLAAAIVAKPDRTLLGPDGFADLLQLVALDPFLDDVPYAYARARERAARARRRARGAGRSARRAALGLRRDAARVGV